MTPEGTTPPPPPTTTSTTTATTGTSPTDAAIKPTQQVLTCIPDATTTTITATTATTATTPEPTTATISDTGFTSKKSSSAFRNASSTGEIPSFDGNEQARATDFANYFCSYAQLYHQKQMLADHQRMAAYHAAILGNAEVFKDKVVMDVGTGSGILAVWAAQAGARKVYAIEYTDMAKHAQTVMEKNNVSDIVTVIQAAVESVELPIEQDQLEVEEGDDEEEEKDNEEKANKDENETNKDTDAAENEKPNDVEGEGVVVQEEKEKKKKSTRCVDIIISEWMGYFLLRESMLDSVLRARDKFLKRRTGLLLPSHVRMYIAPVQDEDERKACQREYAASLSDWRDFCTTTQTVYGVDMTCLDQAFEREQHEYYLLSSRWTELPPHAVLAEPKCIRSYDLMTCTLAEARGIPADDPEATFCFDFNGTRLKEQGPISALSGWFVADFRSREEEDNKNHPGVSTTPLPHPAQLSTGPDQGYTHWGQQTFYFPSSIPLLAGESTRLEGRLELQRTAENARLYHCRITYSASRRKLLTTPKEMNKDSKSDDTATMADRKNKVDLLHPDATTGPILMKSGPVTHVYQIP